MNIELNNTILSLLPKGMKTRTKKSIIKPTKKPFDYNSKRFRKHMERMEGKRKRKRWNWLWERHSNGYSYPSYEEWYTFNWGKFATLLAGIIIILLIGIIAIL